MSLHIKGSKPGLNERGKERDKEVKLLLTDFWVQEWEVHIHLSEVNENASLKPICLIDVFIELPGT